MGKLVRNGIDYSTSMVDGGLDANSINPVQNKVVTAALNEKQDTLTIDTTPTQGSHNPVESGGVYTEIATINATIGDINTVLEGVL